MIQFGADKTLKDNKGLTAYDINKDKKGNFRIILLETNFIPNYLKSQINEIQTDISKIHLQSILLRLYIKNKFN